jgi:hypothetical protein
VKIADFGVALEAKGGKLTQPGTLVGTPPYMPPEQLKGTRADTRSDLFSLGVVWYELLAGDCPYAEPEDAENIGELLRSMEKERYEPIRKRSPRMPRSLRRLLKRCLRAKPGRRLGSARELRIRLEQVLGSPSAADVRSEIAIHLWERGVFEQRENQTLVLAPPAKISHARASLGWLPAGFAAAAILATLLVVDVRPLPRLAPADEARAAGMPGKAETGLTPEARALRASLIAAPFDPMRGWLMHPQWSNLAASPGVLEGEAFEAMAKQLRSYRRR